MANHAKAITKAPSGASGGGRKHQPIDGNRAISGDRPCGAQPLAAGLDHEVEVLKALGRLTGGDFASFADQQEPPPEVMAWIDRAGPRETRGLLSAALCRWVALRG
ncbi:MAG: hypothetical protein AAF790_10405 [Planctomycetota bacterium]